MLLHAGAPPRFWPDALAAATYLLNRRPYRACQHITPYELLLGTPPTYDHIRVFGCLCYPNITATSPHKLAPRSIACMFLGDPVDTKGYRCYDPSTDRILTSRHVYFDESVFPFRSSPSTTPSARAPPPASRGTHLPQIAAPIPPCCRLPQRIATPAHEACPAAAATPPPATPSPPLGGDQNTTPPSEPHMTQPVRAQTPACSTTPPHAHARQDRPHQTKSQIRTRCLGITPACSNHRARCPA